MRLIENFVPVPCMITLTAQPWKLILTTILNNCEAPFPKKNFLFTFWKEHNRLQTIMLICLDISKNRFSCWVFLKSFELKVSNPEATDLYFLPILFNPKVRHSNRVFLKINF